MIPSEASGYQRQRDAVQQKIIVLRSDGYEGHNQRRADASLRMRIAFNLVQIERNPL